MDLTPQQERSYFADGMGDVLGMSFGDAASSYSTKPQLSRAANGNSKNSTVQELQELLISKGYTSVGTADGWFGTNTETAVKQFQTASGLPATGVVDAGTWGKLYESGSGSTSKADKTANTWNSIFSAITQGVQAFGPMVGPKQDYTPGPGTVPPTPGPVVQTPAKSFPWGTVAIVGVGGLILVGGLIFVMKR